MSYSVTACPETVLQQAVVDTFHFLRFTTALWCAKL